MNLTRKELGNKSDCKNTYSWRQLTQLLHPSSQYTYNSIKNDNRFTNHSFFEVKKEQKIQ